MISKNAKEMKRNVQKNIKKPTKLTLQKIYDCERGNCKPVI